MDIREKVESFVENYNKGRLDVCYNIAKFFVKHKVYHQGFYSLFLLMKIIKKEPLKKLPYIHKLIAELLNKKYSFLSFYQTVTEADLFLGDYDDTVKSFVSFEYHEEESILDNFSQQITWKYQRQYKEEFMLYFFGKVTECSWLRSSFGSCFEERPTIYLNDIIKKKIKIYSWDSTFKFGENKGKSIKEIFVCNPKIISYYIENLHHFALSLDFWVSLDTFKIYYRLENKYWDLFEKNLIKIIVGGLQSQRLYEIQRLKKEYEREWIRDNDISDCYYGDDEESQIMRGLMNGNGDSFGF